MKAKSISFQGLQGTLLSYNDSSEFLAGNARLTQAPLFNQKFTLQESLTGFDASNIRGSLTSSKDVDLFLSLVPVNEISLEEELVIDQFKQGKKFVVAFIGHDKGLLRHELCHALYCCNTLFKNDIDSCWGNLQPEAREYVEKILRSIGYSEPEFATEFSAYMIAGFSNQEKLRIFSEDPASFKRLESILQEARLTRQLTFV